MSAGAAEPMDPLLVTEPGHTEILLGNEAIVRAALESGVAFASGYPGTPSSEITDSFARISRQHGIVFEYSINEKIALEMAFAASLAGARSICAMKHLGLMVAGDPLTTIPYVGVEAGMVIVSAGDPSCNTSPNEHDQRHLGPMLHIPVLDPSSPVEAYRLTRFAFELSEASRLPVLLRTTTHVCHSRAPIEYGALAEPHVRGFQPNPSRHVPIPQNARRMRREITGRLGIAREKIESASLLRRIGSGPLGILACGGPAATTADVIRQLDLASQVSLWTLSALHPLPDKGLLECIREVDRLLVVEELTPFLESAVASLAARNGVLVEILGKGSGHLPEPFAYTPAIIQRGIAEAFGICPPPAAGSDAPAAPPRPPSLCPGCPHRASFLAARAAFPDDQVFFNDIGCYTLGYGEPLETTDALLCMGAGFTLAAGVARVTGKRTVGFIGDGTFFHSGMPALLNAIKEHVNMVAVILDNQVTAMTGFQESASDPGGHGASIEAVVRGLGAEHVQVVDPYDLARATDAFRRARDATGVSVVIVERACPVNQVRKIGRPRDVTTYTIDADRCRTCGREVAGRRCNQDLTKGYARQRARCGAASNRNFLGSAPEFSPCSERCPLSLCVQGYVGHIAAGEYAEALGHIMAGTPLPESVCRLCHRPCEDACVRRDIDAPVAINDLKRFVIEWAASQRDSPYRPDLDTDNGMKVAVVGAGPSGLAAAHDLRLRGYGVTVLDANERAGGVLAYGVPAYRLPPDALGRDIARIVDLGVALELSTALGRDVSLRGLFDRGYDAVYLAVGAGHGRRLELAGADAAGAPKITEALEYLIADDCGASISSGDEVVVVVIGGGNAAPDAARTARRRGANVVIACLELRNEMPAFPEEIAAAEAEGISVQCGVEPARVEPGAVVLRSLTTAEEFSLAADQVVLAIGQDPVTDFAGGDTDFALDRDGDGCLRIDPGTCGTNHPRIFAGGDVAGATGRTVTAAIAQGRRAAWSIDTTLRGAEQADRRPPPELIGPAPEVPQVEARARPRVQTPELPSSTRTQNFDEVVRTLSAEQARAEASRCLACGLCGNCRVCVEQFGCPALKSNGNLIEIEPSLCTGCGVCEHVCPNQAIVPAAAGAARQTTTDLSLTPLQASPVTRPRTIAHNVPATGRCNIMLVGVGGQGVLSTAQILGAAAHAAGLPVVVGQLHGMSQKGGTVQCTVLIGEGDSSYITAASAGLVIGFDPLETLRAMPIVGEQTLVVANRGSIVPFELTLRGQSYPDPETIFADLVGTAREVVLVDGPSLVARVGVPRTLNAVMLGAVAALGILPVDGETLWQAITRRYPQSFHAANRRAFDLGRQWFDAAPATARARASDPAARGEIP